MLFPPCKVVVDFFFDEEERRYAITRRQRKEHKKGEKLARASQNSPYSNPLCPFFPSSFHSFICHAGGEIQKRSICISKTERKQTMKKRAPTLPPTIIDRGLSMIAMRVTFSRACARARKKISFCSHTTSFSTSHSRLNARDTRLCAGGQKREHRTRARTKIWHHHRKTTLRNEARRTTTRAPGRRNRSSPRTRSL